MVVNLQALKRNIHVQRGCKLAGTAGCPVACVLLQTKMSPVVASYTHIPVLWRLW